MPFADLNLEATNIAKRFGRRILFKDVSFSLQAGSSIAVTGANGAGKTTLLRILAGVLTPSKGHIRMHQHGAPVPSEDHPLCVGLVAPYLNVYDGFSPYENLRFIARARQLSDRSSRINNVLDLVALSDRAHDLVATFSSGMKQRVKFAAALLPEPALLLLDEPNANLDAAGLDMVRLLIQQYKDDGRLVVVATNDAEEADRHDRTLHIEDYA